MSLTVKSSKISPWLYYQGPEVAAALRSWQLDCLDIFWWSHWRERTEMPKSDVRIGFCRFHGWVQPAIQPISSYHLSHTTYKKLNYLMIYVLGGFKIYQQHIGSRVFTNFYWLRVGHHTKSWTISSVYQCRFVMIFMAWRYTLAFLGSIVLDIDACVYQRLNFWYLLFYFIDIGR